MPSLRRQHADFLILGAGPCGLGAVTRLHELGGTDWALLEASDRPGGLAASFVDDRGFTWDIGGHVLFSHYDYFDRVMDAAIDQTGWRHHERESWIWMRDCFVPYPFQNNIHRLPPDDIYRCLVGLIDAVTQPHSDPTNFRDWILAHFGEGIGELFLLPYNRKVWAHPLDLMGTSWMGERVATVDLKRILHNVLFATDDLSWGPNSVFRYPLRGGTGAIWKGCACLLPQDRLHFGSLVTRIDLGSHSVYTANGEEWTYGCLISTIPLCELVALCGASQFSDLARNSLLHTSSNVFGVGLRGTPPDDLKTKCWIYFADPDCPFYRVTVLSNYSPYNVPLDGSYWSLLAEVSESTHKPVNSATIMEEVTRGLVGARLVQDANDIVSLWHHRVEYGYPVPSLKRDSALDAILPFLEAHGVYSRGRFGLWKYEVGNQDHSFMQGVEVVDHLVNGRQEITGRDADYANSRKHPWPFERWT